MGSTIMPDSDRGARRELLFVSYKGLPFPSYTLRLATLAKKVALDGIQLVGEDGVMIGNRLVPTSPYYDYLVTFTEP